LIESDRVSSNPDALVLNYRNRQASAEMRRRGKPLPANKDKQRSQAFCSYKPNNNKNTLWSVPRI
jgi:hypothetical protein